MYRSPSQSGWKPDLPDFRDFIYAAPSNVLATLPDNVDMRPQCPRVYTQAQIGDCTGEALAGAFEFELLKQGLTDFVPSRLFIYYNERVLDGHVNIDSGAHIRDGMHVVHKIGVCNELLWPYVPSELTKKPYESCYAEALQHKITSYLRINRDVDQMRACLADGYPFLAGFSIYTSFNSPDTTSTGVVNLPKKGEKLEGAHAAVAVGYDNLQERFIMRNSWGDQWGMRGYFTMPYNYLMNEHLSSDFWTIRMVASTAQPLSVISNPTA